MNGFETALKLSFWAAALFFMAACAQNIGGAPTEDKRQETVMVAFIGDQGIGWGARRVLELIKDEGAHAVLHQGDFDYKDNPAAWDGMISQILGPGFPYFASVGNHDKPRFRGPDGYQEMLERRLRLISGARCKGDLGVMSACTYRNLFFVLSGIGTIPRRPDEPRHIAFIRQQLAESGSEWKICSWHKNQRTMQVGDKQDEVGWAAYRACREAGAIIVTGHEHSYSRTHLMHDFENKVVASASPILRIAPGHSFVVVSGLGGGDIRRQRHGGPWWAAVYAKDHGAAHGALFCEFSGNSKGLARCYFKDIAGRIIDRFMIINQGGKPVVPSS